MLTIVIPSIELFDEKEQIFVRTKAYDLQLEHSLVSLAKWESKWQKPFLSTKDKTAQESIDYIRCMTISQNVDPQAYANIRQREIDLIAEYIEAPMTATTFSDPKDKATSKEVITAEIIYYWMVAFTIPFECQKWHLNRLLALINVCSIKNQKPKKMSHRSAMQRQRELNASRKAKLNTKG